MPVAPRFPRLSDCLAWQAARDGAAEALVFGAERISYAALHARVERISAALIAAGIRPGDRVATLAPPSPDAFALFLATASVGAIWAGLNPRYRLQELLHPVTDCAPALLFARTLIDGRDYSGEIAALVAAADVPTVVTLDSEVAGWVPMEQFLAAGQAVSAQRLAETRRNAGGREPCMLVYTSGSTGVPKGALLQQQGIIDFAIEQNRLWPVKPLRMLNFYPVNHIGSFVDLACPALLAGGCTIFAERFDAAESLDLMTRERVSFWGGVPSVFSLQMAEQKRAPRDLSAVQLIVWEGAPISEALFAELADFGLPMATTYSQTESTSAVTATPPTHDADLLLNSVGHPFEGVEVRLGDAEGKPVPEGTPGEIQARSGYCFLGYWNRPEATAETFTADGYLRTGDLAEQRPDGSYRLVGRLKEMFKSGGYNVYPREIEAVLEALPEVAEAVVVPVPDPLWTEVGIAYVRLSAPTEGADLLEAARAQLAAYKLPKRIEIVDEMPLLPIGKVDRVALRRRAEATYGEGIVMR
jgi:acyl-CoA synthetase (AMP-forming)/AMP-acid ligase II